MLTPKVIEVSRLSAHRREVALVRASLLFGPTPREVATQRASRAGR